MPSLVIQPSACSATSGWKDLYYYKSTNSAHYPRQLLFTYYAPNDIIWNAIVITAIQISGYVRNGASVAKRLRMGFRPSANSGVSDWESIDGTNILDASFTAVNAIDSGTRYNRFTRRYSESSNSEVFALFSSHIIDSFSSGDPIYLGIIQPNDGRSIQVEPALSNWTITIEYDILGSMPSLNKESYHMGETVTVSLNIFEDGATHIVEYYVGSDTTAYYSKQLGVGVAQTTWTIPSTSTFGEKLSGNSTANLRVSVTTYVGNEQRGTLSANASIGLPNNSAPTVSHTVTRIGQTEVNAYIQGQSGVRISINATPKYGAVISQYSITLEGVTKNTQTAEFPVIYGSGSIPCSYTVTDSRGVSTTNTTAINVIPWEAPIITRFLATRVTASNQESIDGTCVRCTAIASVSPIAIGNAQSNELYYQIQYHEIGSMSEWIDTDIIYSNDCSVNNAALLTSGGTPINSFGDLLGYEFRLVVSDRFSYSTAFSEIPTKEVLMHIKRSARSVAFGRKSTGGATNPKFEVAHNATFDRDVSVGGNMHITGTLTFGDSSSSPSDGQPFNVYSPMYAYAGIANFRAGVISSISLASNSAQNTDVVFDPPYPAGVIPIVVVGAVGTSTGGYATGSTSVVLVTDSVTNEGFMIRRYNNTSAARSLGTTYIAYAPVMDAMSQYSPLLDSQGNTISDSNGDEILMNGEYQSAYTGAEIDAFIEEVTT